MNIAPSQSITRLLQQYQNIQSILFTTDYSHFQSFPQMQNFLQCSDTSLSQKISQIQTKMSSVHQQYIRTSTVYQINNKKRAKQIQLLSIQRNKIQQDLKIQKQRLQIQLHPITLTLRQKQNQISKLYQTKQIILDFQKLLKGDQQQLKKLMPLDQKNFNTSSLKIFIFKQLIQDNYFSKPQFQLAKNQIRKKFSQLKNKILINFKQAYYKKNIIMMKQSLSYCEEYQLMDEVSQFYNEQVFKEVHVIMKIQDYYIDNYEQSDQNDENYDKVSTNKISTNIKINTNTKINMNTMNNLNNNINKINQNQKSIKNFAKPNNNKQGQSQIKNFFFLLQRGFLNAFNPKNQSTGQKNFYQLQNILGEYNDTISRKLISYTFQKLIKQSIQNVLKNTFNSGRYLTYLQLFYTQCKLILKKLQPLILDQRINHLMSTYFQSIFDTYLQSYLAKQVSFLSNTLEQHITEITEEIKRSKYGDQNNNQSGQEITSKKFSIKKIMEFKIQEKVYNPEVIRRKINVLGQIFMASEIEKIFMTIKQCLSRNMKIAKINQMQIYHIISNKSVEIRIEMNYQKYLSKILVNYLKY